MRGNIKQRNIFLFSRFSRVKSRNNLLEQKKGYVFISTYPF